MNMQICKCADVQMPQAERNARNGRIGLRDRGQQEGGNVQIYKWRNSW
jgi:hypothetical protein